MRVPLFCSNKVIRRKASARVDRLFKMNYQLIVLLRFGSMPDVQIKLTDKQSRRFVRILVFPVLLYASRAPRWYRSPVCHLQQSKFRSQKEIYFGT